MDALLRELKTGRDGVAEYYDIELTGRELTIGAAADQAIQLLGRTIGAEHAVIKKTGDKLAIECRGAHRVNVNDKEVSAAKLAIGDVIMLDGHRLTVAEAPAGFDVAIELQPNEAVEASDFESAFRTDLSQTWLRKRSVAWWGAGLVALIGLAAPLTAVVLKQQNDPSTPSWLAADQIWSSGPLHPAHTQATGEECATCHRTLFERVQDSACRDCHQSIHDHVASERLAHTSLGSAERCASCHREHDEPQSFMVDRSDAVCVDCHAGSHGEFASLAVAMVSGFGANAHPAFKAHLLKPRPSGESPPSFEWVTEIASLDEAREQSNLKFSHVQHLDADRVLRTSDSQPLKCADCHQLEPDGEHFAPMSMERSCAACHELTFDPGAPDRQLPHGKPREVVLTLQDYFTRKFSDPNPTRATRERRRLPGDEEEQTCMGAPFDCAMRSARAEIETQFSRRGCVGCHVVVDTQAEDVFERFQVVPIRFARDYFPAARFDHRSHQIQGKATGDEACLSCHAANKSDDSADLMLPQIAKCEDCHGDRPSVERVTVQCVSCHSYHPHQGRNALLLHSEQE